MILDHIARNKRRDDMLARGGKYEKGTTTCGTKRS